MQNHNQQSKPAVTIFDTTLRDGDQAPGYALRFMEKLDMARALADAKIDVIEAGFPASSDLDFRAVREIANEITGSRIAALARATSNDIESAGEALRDCARPRIHTFIATSEDHMRDKLGKTPDQVLRSIDNSVRLAVKSVNSKGDVEWSAEDASRSSIDFLAQAVRVAIDAGAKTINLPDTVGYAVPSEYGDMFRRVIAAVKPGPEITFSAHVHNDLGLAAANSIAALHAGARQVECTVRGIGERAGNAQMEAIVAILNVRGDVNPFACNVNTKSLSRIAQLHEGFLKGSPSYLPVVGQNAFAHASGIHQDGTAKGGLYAVMNAQDYGVESETMPLSRHSGMAGVDASLRALGIEMNREDLVDFMTEFKKKASWRLEKYDERIVPIDRLDAWARAFIAPCAKQFVPN